MCVKVVPNDMKKPISDLINCSVESAVMISIERKLIGTNAVNIKYSALL